MASNELSDKKILVTAGPTYEPIDPVRFIGNRSSGKMGFRIAEQLADIGAHVILISGPTSLTSDHPNIKLISVETAAEMFAQCVQYFPECDGTIMAAAVADFTPKNPSDQKVKKGDRDTMSVEMVRTKDILRHLGQNKKENQILAGFSLETENGLENARKKLENKRLDFIVLNLANQKEGGFGRDLNQITIIDKDGSNNEFPLKPKSEVAETIVAHLRKYF